LTVAIASQSFLHLIPGRFNAVRDFFVEWNQAAGDRDNPLIQA